ncbi:MAG: hypothetical protein MJZ70_08375 [Bacteroidales bacterium]|nr:hypothetical protein [Bacteroidales bacterium]
MEKRDVNSSELDQLYNKCIDNFLNHLDDTASTAFSHWKSSLFFDSESPKEARVVAVTMEAFNYWSDLDLSDEIGETFDLTASQIDDLNNISGLSELLYAADPEKFLSVMGLLLEIISEREYFKILIRDCSVQRMEEKLKQYVQNDFLYL